MPKEELIQKYVEGQLDEHDADELLRLLDDDESLLTSLCEDVSFDTRIRTYWKQYVSERKTLDNQALRAVEKEAAIQTVVGNRSGNRISVKSERRHNIVGWKSLIILLILALFIFQVYHEFVPLVELELPAEIETVPLNLTGKIVSVADPVFAPEHPVFKPEQLLENDRIILESGFIELELVNKARLVLEGPIDFQINSPMKLLCNSGRLSAFVPPEAARLEVATPRMVVRDIGTEFFIDVTNKDSSVHVVRGKVDINWFNADWMTFESGEALKLDTENKPLRFPALFDLFITSSEMKRKETAYRQKTNERRGRLHQKWMSDASLLYRLNPIDIAESNFGCRLNEGPSDEMKSIVFSQKTASVPISIASKPRSLTLVSIFRLDTMRRGCNALFMGRDDSDGTSDRLKTGKIYWQLSGRGTIQLMIGKIGSDVPDEYESQPVFSKKNLRTWTCLATTIDAETRNITFYKDGQIIGTLPLKETPELDLTAADIGNWQRRISSKTDVRFNGRIAELFVFNRPLSMDEIRELTIP